jgi:hypothetical protein
VIAYAPPRKLGEFAPGENNKTGYAIRSVAVVLGAVIGASLSISAISSKKSTFQNGVLGVSAAALLVTAYITFTHDVL